MRTIIFGISLCILMTACNKVNQHYILVDAQPWILGTYPTSYYAGDTMTISGKMFLGSGGVLTIGSVQPTFLSIVKSAGAPGSNASDSIDLVRFLITKEMGVGKNISVTLTANGVTISAPSITILQFSGLLARTDTTLVADQIASWQPADLAVYQSQQIPLIIGSSVSGNGNIFFDNPRGIFSLIGGSVQTVLSVGNQLSDNAGTFWVNKVLGSAISNDGNTLAFSVAVSDNSDTVNNYVFRFCTMNMGSGSITTLNRTLESKGIPAQSASPGAFEGTSALVNMVAASINSDVNGNWYFSNIYAVPYTGIDMGAWYANCINNKNSLSSTGNELDNICKIGTDGKVRSLFSFGHIPGLSPKIFQTPGYPIIETANTLISPDGSKAFVHTNMGSATDDFNEAAYDLNLQVILSAPLADANFAFVSYDTSKATGQPAFFGPYGTDLVDQYSPAGGAPNLFLALPNGYVIGNSSESSLYAFNVLNQTVYCYAGTEQGVAGSAPAAQNQLTGPAKYVNFSLNGNATYFNGVDNKGAVYYFMASGAAGNAYGQPVLAGPVTFYKLHSNNN